jgi:hypothetical protein
MEPADPVSLLGTLGLAADLLYIAFLESHDKAHEAHLCGVCDQPLLLPGEAREITLFQFEDMGLEPWTPTCFVCWGSAGLGPN